MTASPISSERFGVRGVPRYVSIAWLSVSNAPEIPCFFGSVSIVSTSRMAKSANEPQSGDFCPRSSFVMTAPLFISAPVPEAVTTAPNGMPAPGFPFSSYSSVQMSFSVFA